MTEQQKQANRFLRRKSKALGHKDLRMLIVKNFGNKLDLIEEWKKMESWCASKHNKSVNMLRFNNWVKKAVQFRQERAGGRMNTLEEWKEEERKTLERQKQMNSNE